MLAGFQSQGDTPYDRMLIAGNEETVSRQATLLSGQNCLRGTLLGNVSVGAGSSVAKGGNTGNATMSAITVNTGAKPGVYSVRMLTATTYRVEDPDGFVLGDGATGTAFSDDIGFTMTVGGTAMVAGDGFDVTVAAGSGKYVKSLSSASDGSQIPSAILAEDCDATSADKVTIAYLKGTFNENAIIYGTGHTAASVREALRHVGINLQPTIV